MLKQLLDEYEKTYLGAKDQSDEEYLSKFGPTRPLGTLPKCVNPVLNNYPEYLSRIWGT